VAWYCAATCVLMVIMMPWLVDPFGMFLMRLEWLALTLAVIALSYYLTHSPRFSGYQPYTGPLTHFLRVLLQMAWLALWYPDTYEFNRCFNNLDHLFAAADQQLFGCQPSIVFSQQLPQAIWSEAFNLGYWSYFPMMAVLLAAIFWIEWRSAAKTAVHRTDVCIPSLWGREGAFQQVAATILTAFFLYYAVYIFLPVAGPQFYFQAVGVEDILQGHFPALGTYFSSHTEMLPSPGYADGLFYHLVSDAQSMGERPTAAFPSSHIGISTIVLLLTRRHVPRLLPFLLPLWVLLFCATVYIQAHYLIDSIAGLVTAPFVLYLAHRLVVSMRLHRS